MAIKNTIILLSILMLFSCNKIHHYYAGYVVDESGQPLSGVLVREKSGFRPRQTTTDESGYFKLMREKGIICQLIFEKKAYETKCELIFWTTGNEDGLFDNTARYSSILLSDTTRIVLQAADPNIEAEEETMHSTYIYPNDTLISGKDVSDPTNTLNGKTETLKLKYIVWGCVCPNWITISDFEKYQDDELGIHCIFIEPASEDLELPSNFDPFKHYIQVTGQFYIKQDYPKGTMSGEQQPLYKAKVFQYTKIGIADL